MIAIVPPNIVLPTPSWAPPSTRMSTPQTLNAPRPEPPIEPPLKCRSASESIVDGGAPSGRKMRARESAPASSVPSTRSLASTGRGSTRARRDPCCAVAGLAARRRRRGRLASPEIETGPPQTSVASAASSCEACFGLHPDRPRDDQAGRLALLLGADRHVDRLEVEHLLERADHLGEVDRLLRARLHEQVAAADEVLRALVAELGDDLAHLLAHPGEEARAVLGGALELLRRELLEALLLGLLHRTRSASRCRRGRCRAGSRGRSCSRSTPSRACRTRRGWRRGSAASRCPSRGGSRRRPRSRRGCGCRPRAARGARRACRCPTAGRRGAARAGARRRCRPRSPRA